MADLTKFGVPLPGGGVNGILHPKQKYRFRVVFSGFGINQQLRELTQNVVSCSRPKITYDEVKLDSYNSVVWIQGKHSFEAIELKVRDDITNAVISAVGAQVQKQMNHFEQTSAVAGNNYKFAMQIHSLDGTRAEELEAWELDGCWLTNITYDEGDYASGEAQVVSMTIRYDNATNIAGANTNGGTVIGGDPFPNFAAPYSPFGGTAAT